MHYKVLNSLESAADEEQFVSAETLAYRLTDIIEAADMGTEDLPMIHAVISSNVGRITARAMRIIMVHMGLIDSNEKEPLPETPKDTLAEPNAGKVE